MSILERPENNKEKKEFKGMRLSGSREQAIKIKKALIKKRQGLRTIGKIR